MSATQNSIANPTRGGITRLNRMIAPPTANTVKVWPSPHSTPIEAALRTLPCRDTIVLTAMTWSASVACSMPSRNPITMTGS
jgi:hypothetical protein